MGLHVGLRGQRNESIEQVESNVATAHPSGEIRVMRRVTKGMLAVFASSLGYGALPILAKLTLSHVQLEQEVRNLWKDQVNFLALNRINDSSELEHRVVLLLTNRNHFNLVLGQVVLYEVHVGDLLTLRLLESEIIDESTEDQGSQANVLPLWTTAIWIPNKVLPVVLAVFVATGLLLFLVRLLFTI